MRNALPAVPLLVALLAAGQAAAEEPGGAVTADGGEGGGEEDDGSGLNLDLGFATAYVFRGLNVFADGDQLDPHMLLAPGITWAVFDTGLWLGYWGAFQVSGDNLSDNVDAGVGVEQDLLLGWDRDLGDAATVSLFLYWYFYPAADEEAAGAAVPSYLDPGAMLTVHPGVDVSLSVSRCRTNKGPLCFAVQHVLDPSNIRFSASTPALSRSIRTRSASSRPRV